MEDRRVAEAVRAACDEDLRTAFADRVAERLARTMASDVVWALGVPLLTESAVREVLAARRRTAATVVDPD